ncbi:MAG TPA: RNA methyltransferase [Solirubrobacteraceae bacterium]|nr:RNA methyltransferase [Solirubrobacteraceae bacterium]
MTATIESPHNPRLQALRRLQRRRERATSGRFLAEGEDLIAAAAQAGWEPLEGYRAAGSGLGDTRFCDVAPAALAAVSALGSGTRAIGVYRQRWSPSPLGPLCVYLHGLADPGNVGSVLRSALAFGASSAALGPGCADPYSPKAVRASMGAIFAVALARVEDVAALPGLRVALVAHAGRPLRELAPVLRKEGALSLLVGAEREGLPAAVLADCEHVAHIPIRGDSLNAATAAAIALYEVSHPTGAAADPSQLAAPQPAAPPSRVQAP